VFYSAYIFTVLKLFTFTVIFSQALIFASHGYAPVSESRDRRYVFVYGCDMSVLHSNFVYVQKISVIFWLSESYYFRLPIIDY